MAQTKKRSTSSRTGSSKRSRSTKSKPANSKPASTRSSSSRSSRSSGNGSGSSDASNGIEAVRDTVEDKAKSAGQTVGKAAGKAKLPLVASGAALAGAAGGLALASRRAHKGGIGAALRKPKIQLKSDDVARVAKEVGNFSAQVGALATELQRNREDAGNGRHRSPIEVALHGLTSRR
jgi:hypothetical protein